MASVPPSRCFSCGREVASCIEVFQAALQTGLPRAEALQRAGCETLCCRRMLLSEPTRTAWSVLERQHYISRARHLQPSLVPLEKTDES